MSRPLEALDELLRGPVRWRAAPGGKHSRRKGATDLGGLLQKAARVTSRRPEVMVRITSKCRGASHVSEHLAYTTRNGKLIGEDESGQLIIGQRMVRETAMAWMDGSSINRRRNSRDTCNLVLSMPVGTDPDKLLDAAREFAQKEFGGKHAYVFVLHTKDTDPAKKKADHPHVHLTVHSLGFHGQRLNPRKADLQRWREAFAESCRARGIAAEATPRRARGVVKKSIKAAVWHADRDPKSGPRSTVQKGKAREAVAAALNPSVAQPGPWDRAIQSRGKQVRETWNNAARALEETATGNAIALAKQIREFVRQMPTIDTERQDLLRKAREQLQNQDKQQVRDGHSERSI